VGCVCFYFLEPRSPFIRRVLALMLVGSVNPAQTRRCYIKTIRAGLADKFAFNLVLARFDGAPEGPTPPFPCNSSAFPIPLPPLIRHWQMRTARPEVTPPRRPLGAITLTCTISSRPRWPVSLNHTFAKRTHRLRYAALKRRWRLARSQVCRFSAPNQVK